MVALAERQSLAYNQRHGEGLTKNREVHEHWKSDDMWSVFRHEPWIRIERERARSQVELDRRQEVREPSLPSEAGSMESRDSQYKENAPPGRYLRNNYVDEAPISKTGPWMALDSESIQGETPRACAPMSASKAAALSMTPRSISRCDATPMSMTPRSSIAGDAPLRSATQATMSVDGATPRSMTPRNLSPQSRTRGDTTPRGNVTPRSERTPRANVTPRGDTTPCDNLTPRADMAPRGNLTPRGDVTPRGNVTPLGDRTPRAMTPRNAAPRSSTPRNNASTPGLSMMPQLITRPQTPRNGGSTPRGSMCGSASGMRKSASERVFKLNS